MGKSIWPKSSGKRVDSALSAHSVMGLAISAILFVICLSGTVAVFEDELEWWEQAGTPAVTDVTPAAAQVAADGALKRSVDGSSHLYLYLPRSNWPRFITGTDHGFELVDSGGGLAGPLVAPWNDFLIHLHYYLHLPHTIGMIIVATFGVMLVAMSISGLLAHPRIFKDAFRFRRQGQARIVQADLHNRLSVWTAPFHIAVALTGAMIGLFSIAAFVLAQTSFDGDTGKLSEAVFGSEPPADARPAALARIDLALATLAQEVPSAIPFLVVVHDPATVGQHVEIYSEMTDRLIYGETYTFASDGALLSSGGNSDGPLGKQVASSVYRLHFGDFGGFLVKASYFVFGVMLCVIIASGLNIYFIKRAERGRPAPRLAAAWAALVWGSTAMLAVTLTASLVGLSGTELVACFWGGTFLIVLAAILFGLAEEVARILRASLGVVLLVAVLMQGLKHGAEMSSIYTLATSVCLTVAGVVFLIAPIRRARLRRAKSR